MLIQSKQSRTRAATQSSGSSGGSRTYGTASYSTGGLLTPKQSAFADKIAAMNAAAYRSWAIHERKEPEMDWSDPAAVLKERFGPLCNPVYDGPATDMGGQLTGEQCWMVTLNGTRQLYVNIGWEAGKIKISQDARDYYTEVELEGISQAKAILDETKFYIDVAFEAK